MRKRIFTALAAASALALWGPLVSASPAAAGTAAPAQDSSCPWVSSSAPIPQRVDMVLSRMSLAQLDSMVYGQGSYQVGYVGHIPAIPSLCIPQLNLEDGPEGVADGMTGVTQLPAAVSASATWDRSVVQQYGKVIGNEEAGKGTTIDLGPTINIVRDPRWGRAFETYGEDPYLNGQMAAADVKGVQSQGVMAMVKHWDVYNQETNRNTPLDNAIVSKRAMQEIYMPAFKTAVQQGHAAAVMCSYATINGSYACQNSYIDNVLFKQFTFPGFITSDWGANHSTVASAKAGLDMEMPGGTYYGPPLVTAVQNGQVSISVLRTMVRRILTEMFRFHLFIKAPTGSLSAVVTSKAHAATARKVSEQGTVLLKNSEGVLPLQRSTLHSVAVIGASGGVAPMSSGGGSAAVTAPYVVSPLQGIRKAAGPQVAVRYAQGNLPSTGSLPAIPASAFPGGLQVRYYNNTTLSGTPAATGTSPNVDFTWNGSAPAPGVNTSGWSAKWTGQIEAPVTGTYVVSLDAGFGNGARLYVNGNLVINNWSGSQRGTVRGSVTLTAGQPVSVEVDFTQTGFAPLDSLAVGWARSSGLLSQAVQVAKASDVAVVFVGKEESEGSDLSNISLGTAQNQLISAVAKANPDTIVVVNSGSAVTMPWLSKVKGVFEAWYPGQEDGNAIAALLFGTADPSGHLPVTFPKSLADVPAHTTAQFPGVNGKVHYSEGILVGYRWYDAKGIQPLFPFGYGLSYTTFRFSRLHLSSHSVAAGEGLTVTADVTNTGQRAGAETVQAYVGDPASTGEPPEQLKGFQKVQLQPGQTKRVTIHLPASAFSYYNAHTSTWTQARGFYHVMIGDSSASLLLTAKIYIR